MAGNSARVPSFLREYPEKSEILKELGPENCYADPEMDAVCAIWNPALPDYPSSRQAGISAASDTSSRDYVTELRSNFRLNKPRNLFRPSFVNGPPDTFESSHLRKLKPSGSPIPIARVSANKSGQDVTNSSLVGAGDSSGRVTIRRKPIVSQLIESAEAAIENGNTDFVRGAIHPLQGNIGMLRMNRRSGYSNNFTTEEYRANMPADYVPVYSAETHTFTFG